MTQLYFGPSDEPLYGVYHAPLQAAVRAPAVLLCNPLGVEAIRAFRIFRILAVKLAEAGSPVLRFDYHGSGDSSGACDTLSVTSAGEDILTAHQELVDMSGAKRVVWLGLRLGAAFCLNASQDRPRGLSGLCLWDPVLSGRDYLGALGEAHLQELARVFDQPAAAVQAARTKSVQEQEALGFSLGEGLRDELDQLEFKSLDVRPARTISIIAETPMPELTRQLESLGAKTTFHKDEEAQSWNSDAALNAFVVPRKTIDNVVGAVGEMR